MGRSVKSVRQGVNETTRRWVRSAQALPGRRQTCGERLAVFAKQHSSEAFYVCEDPLEAAVFSALVEILRYRDTQGQGGKEPDVDS
nr:hypothetical protein [uncultured Methanoregula sp.]